MPTSSQFKIIDTLEKRRRVPAAVGQWHLATNPGGHQSEIESTSNNSVEYSGYLSKPTSAWPTTPDASTSATFGQKTARLKRHSSCFHFGQRAAVKYDTTRRPGTGNRQDSYSANENASARDTTIASSQGSISITSDDPIQSEDMAGCSGEFRNLLYCLGFRGVPGEMGREDINSVFKHRPGIKKKVDKISMEEKGEEPVVIEGITTESVQKIDINSIDPGLLKPTALCFDTNGLSISHKEVKAALDKILIHCDGAVVRTIQFENRRLKDGNLPNRWMIYTDSQDSRNIICGRQLTFGEKYVVLRRYDDLVLLAHKKALRAQAWKNVLGSK